MGSDFHAAERHEEMGGAVYAQRTHKATIVAARIVFVCHYEVVCLALRYATHGWSGMKGCHKMAEKVLLVSGETEVGAQVDKLSGTHGIRALHGEV